MTSRKRMAVCLLLLCFSTAIASTTFDIGGVPVLIPSPHGYVEVTPKMTAVWQVFQALIKTNRALASYIPEAEQSAALAGRKTNLYRNTSVQVSRSLEDRVLTSDEFEQMRKGVEAIVASHLANTVENKAVENASGNLAKLYGFNPQLSQTRNLTLPLHVSQEDEFSYSEISTEQITMPDGSIRRTEVTQTATTIFIKGKILMFYVNGTANDLNWTRAVAREWADSIIAAN